MKKTDLPEILQTTLALAEKWQNRANTLRTKDELTTADDAPFAQSSVRQNGSDAFG